MDLREEIELKLRVDPDGEASMHQSDWWRGLGAGTRKRLHRIYFDTSDRRLRHLDISLHTRTDGRDTVQTVKMTNGASVGAGHREWETLVPDAVPDPRLVIDAAPPREFPKVTAPDLQPVFNVDITRDTRCLESNGTKIELSFNKGTVTSGQQRHNVREVELKLFSGELAQLFAEARRLSQVAAGRLHARTLSDLGYGLMRTKPRHWSRVQVLRLTPSMTAGDALNTIARNCFEHLTANDDCARLNLHPEGVHQCRVALRPPRSLFRTYEARPHRERVDSIVAEGRWFGMVLGLARDLDVLQRDLFEVASSALGASGQLEPLTARLNENKTRAYSAVWEALSSSRYRHFLVDLCAFGCGNYRDLCSSSLGPDALDQPLPQFAASALAGAHHKLLKRGRAFETLRQSERHRVRIALKKLRYAVDFFGGLFDQ